MKSHDDGTQNVEEVAGNGLLHRRMFLSGGASVLGSMGLLSALPASADPLEMPQSMKAPGAHMSAYGQPSEYEQGVQRMVSGPPGLVTGSGVSFTPLEKIHGTITPQRSAF